MILLQLGAHRCWKVCQPQREDFLLLVVGGAGMGGRAWGSDCPVLSCPVLFCFRLPGLFLTAAPRTKCSLQDGREKRYREGALGDGVAPVCHSETGSVGKCACL